MVREWAQTRDPSISNFGDVKMYIRTAYNKTHPDDPYIPEKNVYGGAYIGPSYDDLVRASRQTAAKRIALREKVDA
jgi:hypothetical protein